ncbi:hypothetical protein B0H16DRAFT_1703495 [Mycena metata]|uniref:Uncharacterized protein n=1 Tax=Mycena metata TaxID=1033252 RepID=A0AAD7H4K4_9AGAR|nr:hypothetical protein B0H16DRAFT_1703495 [Mycena metata]
MVGCFVWRTRNEKQTKLHEAPVHEASVQASSVKPTPAQYMLGGAKELVSVAGIIAGAVPVPLLPEFMKFALNVIEACEDATAVEEKAKDLQKRVYSLSIIIIDKLKVGDGVEDLRSRIKDLQSTLDGISKDLKEIKNQRKWLLVFFRNLNKDKVDECVVRINAALEEFNLSHHMHMEESVHEILSRYSIITSQLATIDAKVDNANATLDQIFQTMTNTSKPHNAPEILLREDMPPLHRIFGRQPLVDDIVSLLADPLTSHVLITGPGGMGKTSVALAVIESVTIREMFPKKYQFWVPCVKATSSDLLRRILYTQLRVRADTYESLDPLIDELSASTERRLLLLDNFETPWFSGDADRVNINDILFRLARLPHIALLVTMTSALTFPPSGDVKWQTRELTPLNVNAARETFKGVYPGAADDKLDDLLEAVGRIPLAIYLMAFQGQHSQASPTSLLEGWETSGTDMLALMDYTISLSINRTGMTSQALTLLEILSMLPAGTNGERLRWWAFTFTPHFPAITILRDRALIEQGAGEFATSHISVRPTIQGYMSRQDRISDKVKQQVHDACYRFVLSHRSTPDDDRFMSDLEALAKEETNIQGLLMQINAQNLHPDALDALIAFSLYQLRKKPSITVAQHALEVALAALDDFHVAEAHECLGKIAHILDRYEEASDPLVLEAKTILTGNPEDKLHVAEGLFGHGDLLGYSDQKHECLEALSAAKAIFEQLKRPARAAECLYEMARTYDSLNQHVEALPVYRQGLVIAEQLGDADIISRISIFMAGCLTVLSSHDEAFTVIQRGLPKALALGRPLAIAQLSERLGYNCAATLDFPAARIAYQRAREYYSNIASTCLGGTGAARCSRNIGKLEGMDVNNSAPLEVLFQ